MSSLAGLGLTAAQEGLYRYLLRNPRTDPDTAAADLGLHDVRPLLAGLSALGLLHDDLTAVAPAAAVDVLVRRRLAEAQRQFTELTQAWDVLTELAEEHRSGRRVQMVEHVPDGASVTRRMRALMADEPGELIHLKIRAHNHRNYSYGNGPFARLLARGLRSRTLFSAECLRDPAQLAYAQQWHAQGDLHRVTSEPTRHLAVVNRAVAFVQADPECPGPGALQIRQPGLVAMVADVFEGMWDRARDLDDLPLSPIEQQVLHALTRHDTDDAAARSLNVSVRKFRAHVADLMARLGAATRFQAALRAKERGWL
jgi:DNA-binding CsgD family transcriptional regulator